jgi:archaemetzincin
LLRRAIQLLAHETGHIFGIEHCTAFECVMNGSNSLAESDRQPLEPCHECLHKLAFALRLQPLPRYRELGSFYEEQGLSADARWIRERSASLTGMQ